MSALTAIMDELAATLEDVVGVTALGDDGWQVVGRMNLNPTPPSIDIYPGDPFGDDTAAGFGALDDGLLLFTVRARVNVLDNDAAQDQLLALMDDENALSVRTALTDDQTLNGLASSVNVDRPSGYTIFTDSGGGGLLGCEFRTTVLNLTT